MTTASSKSRLYGRFIPSEEIDDITQWQFGEVDEARRLAAEMALESVQEPVIDEAMLQQACDEAFEKGREAGRAEGRLEGQQHLDEYIAHQGQLAAERLATLMGELSARLAQSEQMIAQGVLEVACAVARQVVRRELTVEPHSLLAVVREALSLMMADAKPAVVRLNPQDHAGWGAHLDSELALGSQVRWVADPNVAPGGCLVESGGAQVDASVGKRWARAVANLGVESEWSDAPVAHD